MHLDHILELPCPCSHPAPSEQGKQTEAALQKGKKNQDTKWV